MSNLKPGRRSYRFEEMVTSAGATRKARGWSALKASVDRYVGLDHLDSNCLKIRRWGSPEDVGANSDLRHFEPGDVILARRGIELRKVGLAEFRGVASGHALVFRARPEVVLPEFLPFFMQSDVFMTRADRSSVGSLSRTVNLSSLLREEFAIPGLEEQRRVAEVLQACERASDCTQQLIDSTDTTYQAILADLFICARGPEPVDGSSCSSSGTHWKWHRVDEMFSLQLGKMSSRKARESGGHAKYVKNNNVLWGGFSLDDLPSMSFNERERKKFSLEQGDLLVCEGGEIGRAAVWQEAHQDIYFQKALHRLRPIRPDASTRFFMHYLRACSLNGVLNGIATGGTIPHLPRESLAGLRLPFPEISEQRRCLDLLESLQDCLREATKRLALLRSLKAALVVEGMMS